jgi:Leucine-rich repeat (LRR) protein
MSIRRIVTVFILLSLAFACGYALFARFWRDNASPVEKQIARDIELSAYGPGRVDANRDYCIPDLGLPACSAELLEKAAPGTPCYVRKCSRGHVTSLSLYGGRLEELPAEIAGLKGLSELNLHGNHLTRLPPEIGQLNSLTELDLSGNQLSELPAEIGRLANLKKLDVSANRLSSLPPEIGLLRGLNYFNMSGNPIRGPLPGFITQLPLDELNYADTNLCVPVDTGFQGWISGVSIINHHDSPHPTDVCTLAAEDLRAAQALYDIPGRPADWDLKKIPCGWSRVGCDTGGHIISLDLYSLPLQQLPEELWQLSRLRSLNLTGSQVSGLPPEIGSLRGLERLILGSNLLVRLPPEIGQLSHLSELDLAGNRLESLPPEIGQLRNLSSLNLRGNQLEDLPAEIGQLANLTFLDASDNPLSGPLPGFLTNLAAVDFIFSNTGLCVPQNGQILDWLGRQARGVYMTAANGDLVFEPANPEAFIRRTLEQRGCE